jgi:hypothetical protein
MIWPDIGGATRTQLAVEQVHHPAQRVPVRHWRANARKAHPRQPVAQQDLGPRTGQIVPRQFDQDLDHRDLAEVRVAVFGAAPIAQPCGGVAPVGLQIKGSARGFCAGRRTHSDARAAPQVQRACVES